LLNVFVLKLLILHIVLFFTAISFPQQLTGFENIPWKSSKETVRDSMSLIENIKLGYTKEDVLGFSGGDFMSNEVYYWSFHFYDDKLHTVDIVFRNTYSLDLLRSGILSFLRNKYGEEDIEKPDDNGNLASAWYFLDEQGNPIELINLVLFETARGDKTYQLTYVSIKLFEESEQGD
jgi:hypothetical protein